jgi:hypothetical protein
MDIQGEYQLTRHFRQSHIKCTEATAAVQTVFIGHDGWYRFAREDLT